MDPDPSPSTSDGALRYRVDGTGTTVAVLPATCKLGLHVFVPGEGTAVSSRGEVRIQCPACARIPGVDHTWRLTGHRPIPDRGCHRSSARRRRHALLQPGLGDEAGRGGRHAADGAGRHRDGGHRGPGAGEDSGAPRGDRAGFIVNALLFPHLNRAARMLDDRHAGVAEVDRVLTAGAGHPLGPFQLLDLIGLDVAVAILDRLRAATGDPGLVPARQLGYLAASRHLGRKSGQGFYRHPAR